MYEAIQPNSLQEYEQLLSGWKHGSDLLANTLVKTLDSTEAGLEYFFEIALVNYIGANGSVLI